MACILIRTTLSTGDVKLRVDEGPPTVSQLNLLYGCASASRKPHFGAINAAVNTGEGERYLWLYPCLNLSRKCRTKQVQVLCLHPDCLLPKEWSGDESPRRMTLILYLFVWLQVQVAPVWYTVPCLLDLFHLLARWILQH